MSLTGDDEVVDMICMKEDSGETVLVVSEAGYGKRSQLGEYRVTNRGGKGVKTLNVTERTGKLVTIKNVNDGQDLVIINKSGMTIRVHVTDLRIMGRATQGVKLINLEKRNDEIASICKVAREAEDDDDIGDTALPTPIVEDVAPETSTPEIEDDEASDNETEN